MQEFFLLHPYWAFATKPGVTMRQRLTPQHIARLHAPNPPETAAWQDVPANNHGFVSRHDYPYEPGKDVFILGLFGSSIAQCFSVQTGATLARDLEVGLATNRPVEVLNFGLGGFKQPQSLFVLIHFLLSGQRFDAIVLLDGFTEAALSWMNQQRAVPIVQPSALHMDMFAEVPAQFPPPAPQEKLNDSGAVARIANLWQDSALMMRQLCQVRNIPFVLFLHPNQYCSSKTLTEAEHEFAVHDRSPYKGGVEAVYPELIRRVNDLYGRGLAAFDATAIFDEVSDTVYADNCCHFNDLGNAILERFMVDRIVSHWDRASSA
jgi:hypothetical protein